MQKYYCSNCGQPINPYANFCPYCGVAQHHSAQPTAPPPQTPQHAPQQPPVAPPAEKASPDTEIVPRRHLAPRAQVVFFINYVIMTSILLPFIIAYMFFDPWLALIFLACYVLFCLLAALISYNNFYFAIDEHGFEKDYGVFFKRHVSIPYEQIANVNTSRTLVDRFLGIARLDVETAGSASPRKREITGGIRSSSEGHLPGISAEDAIEFHDILLRKMANSDS